MLDDDLLTGHGDGAFGERHRRDHGQELGCQANGQRNRKQQRLKRIAVACNADDNQKENEKKNRSREELAEIPQAFDRRLSLRGVRRGELQYRQRQSVAPVATTSAVAVPLTTDVPRKTMLRASALVEAGSPVASFSAGSDSPVNDACRT